MKKYKTLWARIKAKFESPEWKHLYDNQFVASSYDEIVNFGWQCYRMGKMDCKKELEGKFLNGRWQIEYMEKHAKRALEKKGNNC